MSLTHIDVRGARQHNLRDISVSIPRNSLTVVTGLSGSGKSSLAFDTIYAEGQRRYVETLSAYARQFLDQMERPDVDSIDGLSPAISIEQKTTSRSPRSTVGTITEIYDYLRLLWASVGQPHCPNCHQLISRQSADQIVSQIVERNQTESPGERITVLAPIVRGRKGEFREELEALDRKGYRVRIDGEITEIEEGMRLEKRKNHTVEAIVDRIILKPLATTDQPRPTAPTNEASSRPEREARSGETPAFGSEPQDPSSRPEREARSGETPVFRSAPQDLSSRPEREARSGETPVFRSEPQDLSSRPEREARSGETPVFRSEPQDLSSRPEDSQLHRESVAERPAFSPEAPPKPQFDTKRLQAAVTTALSLANGLVLMGLQPPGGDYTETLFSTSMACPDCGINVPKLEPRSFSFNSTYGACPECHGLGSIFDFDPAKVISDWSKPLLDGALGPGSASQYLVRAVKLAAEKFKIDLKQPFEELPKPQQDLLLYGPPRTEGARLGFHGIFRYLRDNMEESKSEGYREYMMGFMSASECPRCHGARLRPESLAVTLPVAAASVHPPVNKDEDDTEPIQSSDARRDVSVAEFTALSLQRALAAARSMAFTGRDRLIADRLQREIIERLEFLNAVGLGYLSLSRSAATLSGGEGQRIRLATQIGSRLRGVLYVLDEPSIGLHQRDNQRLIHALEDLRNLGNTVLVVEHDEDTIRKADYVLDLGPGAGKNGGQLMASGTPAEIMANPASVTGQYLSGAIDIVTRPTPGKAPRPLDGRWLSVEDATSHNLVHVTAHFPVGVMTVVTGVSGSGKSTLVNDILYRSLARELYKSREEPGAHKAIHGADQFDKVIQIDQSPIGRTPRSNPATYTGVFTAIRDLFAMLPESRERGYKPGRFSFNVQGGRCEACQGEGQRRIEMNFLPDVYVLCEVCNGRRYNQETLAVKFNGYSIADILELPIEDAVPILKDIPAVHQRLSTLVDVGLGYIHLGQSATTLSGGEAQRMKLAKELSKRQTGRTLYLLDEPTTGLHFDDVRRLLEVLHRLTDLGNTVIIIEHNLDIIRNADFLVDMGPEGGEGGGRIVAQGPPELVAHAPDSHTGSFLARYYERDSGLTAHLTLPPINLPDLAKKPPRPKRDAPEKKMGVPVASKTRPAEGRNNGAQPAKAARKPAKSKVEPIA